MIEDERVGGAARIVVLPVVLGAALLALSGGAARTPDGERMVLVLLAVCCACLIVGATLVAGRSRRLEVALDEARDQGPDRTCPVGLFRVDADGRLTWVSDGWCALTGRSRESALGERWEDVLQLRERGRARRAFQQAVQADRRLSIDHVVAGPDGEETHVVGQLSPEGTGPYVGVFTALDDSPAERRRAA